MIWDKLFTALLKVLDRVAVFLSGMIIVNQHNKIEDLEKEKEITDEVKTIKDNNAKLSRDALIKLLSSDGG